MREITVKYEGKCANCKTTLLIGTQAMYEKTTGIFCIGCEPKDSEEIRTYRQTRLDRKNERRAEWAEKAEKKADVINKSLEPYRDWNFITQPILVGHHSEGRHRNLLKRIHSKMDKAHGLKKLAKHHAELSHQTARVAGDAERKRQTEREELDKIINVGSRVYDFCFREGTVKKVNKKSYTIDFDGGFTYAREKTFVKPL